VKGSAFAGGNIFWSLSNHTRKTLDACHCCGL